MRSIQAIGLAVLLAALGRTGFCQSGPGSDLRVVSSFVAVGQAVPEECREQVEVVTRVIAGYPQPSGWHWVLVCDAAAWQRFLRLSGRPGQNDILASTDLEGRITYLRGDKLLHPGDVRAGIGAVIGHELAHIRLGSEDELSADRLSRSWQKFGDASLSGAE